MRRIPESIQLFVDNVKLLPNGGKLILFIVILMFCEIFNMEIVDYSY